MISFYSLSVAIAVFYFVIQVGIALYPSFCLACFLTFSLIGAFLSLVLPCSNLSNWCLPSSFPLLYSHSSGACPPCPQTIRVACYCGQGAPVLRRCGSRGWSCGRVCGKGLTCGKHRCGALCHMGRWARHVQGRGPLGVSE